MNKLTRRDLAAAMNLQVDNEKVGKVYIAYLNLLKRGAPVMLANGAVLSIIEKVLNGTNTQMEPVKSYAKGNPFGEATQAGMRSMMERTIMSTPSNKQETQITNFFLDQEYAGPDEQKAVKAKALGNLFSEIAKEFGVVLTATAVDGTTLAMLPDGSLQTANVEPASFDEQVNSAPIEPEEPEEEIKDTLQKICNELGVGVVAKNKDTGETIELHPEGANLEGCSLTDLIGNDCDLSDEAGVARSIADAFKLDVTQEAEDLPLTDETRVSLNQGRVEHPVIGYYKWCACERKEAHKGKSLRAYIAMIEKFQHDGGITDEQAVQAIIEAKEAKALVSSK